ncbi:probable basic-leucine zipper transcription factor F isoform X2 [Aricia agestis]|nr:probable basic-leucine zipper transcription factor F isoform X2 [Aricia agestis]
MIQDTVLEKIMKYLEQMNTSKNGPQNRVNNFQFSNRNKKIIDKDNAKFTTETYLRNLNKQENYDITNQNYKLAVPRHKKKASVHKDIQRQKKHKLLKDKIEEPKTVQTNELQIAPLGIYVDSFVSPINQNIIVASHNKKRGDNRNKNVNYYKPLERNEIQNNPSPPKYRTNIPPPTSNVRSSQQYNINSYTNYDYQKNHMSEEHDVKYLDDKFLNKVVKDSTAPKLPSNKDCCDREYLSQLMYECCNDKVVSRSLEPLINNDYNEANDRGYGSFIQSQNKVNVMLARALASRSKFRSVESI